jgi:putative ABC transport system substrate-binding protein
MKRIAFIVTLTLTLLAAPFAAEAQQMYRVGLVSIGGDPQWWRPFIEAMGELGYVEGRNLMVKRAFANGRIEDLPRLVHDLVRSGVDVAVTTATRETAAVKQAAPTLPIVMLLVPDPVASGLVESLARPGGNLTGVAGMAPELHEKRLELLKELLPGLTHVTMLVNPTNPILPSLLHDTTRAERALGVHLHRLDVRDAQTLDEALAALTAIPDEALLVPPDTFLLSQRDRIVAFAAQHRLPVISEIKAFTEAGGLLTYGPSLPAQWRRAAYYVDRLLKGAKPADLPVERPTTFELVINLKTAKAPGLTIPPTLLFQADEVIR